MNNKSLLKKLKYGSVAVVFTIVFVVLIVAVNVILTTISNKYPMYFDMTSENLYDISETTVAEMNALEKNVKILFFAKEDKLPDVGGRYLEMVNTLAKKYASSFERVSVEYIDLVSQPNIANRYKKTSADRITQTTVVFLCEETNTSKIVQYEGFYSFMQSENGNRTVYSFDGEKRLTSYIKQVAFAQAPTALFTTGHGEPHPTQLWMGNALYEEGYEVKTINLSSEEISHDAELLVVYYPQFDFAGLEAQKSGGVNEIEKLNNYLKDFGNVIVILSPTTRTELSELDALLAEWGISYTQGAIVTDSSENALDESGFYVIGSYAGDSNGYAYQIHSGVSQQSSAPRPISLYSVPLELSSASARVVEPVIVSSKDAYISTNEQSAPSNRSIPLAALSTMPKNNSDGELNYCNLLVFGSPYFFDTRYASVASYGNSEVFYGMLKYFGNETTTLNIDTKVFENNELKTSATGDTWKKAIVVMSVIAPLIILAIGIIVWRKRRYA